MNEDRSLSEVHSTVAPGTEGSPALFYFRERANTYIMFMGIIIDSKVNELL